MIASTEWKGEMLFEGTSEGGNRLVLDAGSTHAGGPSPVEAVLIALCACTSADVVSILQKKRQPFTSLTVSATAERATEMPRYFTDIQLVYKVGGKVSRKAVEDAVALSKNKYCSVSAMLEKTATIEFLIEYSDGEPLE
jgi:putative redox protein